MELLDRLKAYTKIDGTIFDPVDHAQDTYEAVKMIEALQQTLEAMTADRDRWRELAAVAAEKIKGSWPACGGSGKLKNG